MSEPPVPVDVSREDLRSGRFELNPAAQAQRRAQRLDWRFWAAWVVAYSAGFVAGMAIKRVTHLEKPVQWVFWPGLLAIFLAYGLSRYVYRRVSGGRILSDRVGATLVALLLGALNGLS